MGATTDSGFVPSHRTPASPATRASCSNLVAPRSLSDLAATKLQAQAPAIDRPRSRFEAWRHRSSSPSPTTESSDPALRPGSGRRQCFRCEASCPSPTACVAASWPAGTSASPSTSTPNRCAARSTSPRVPPGHGILPPRLGPGRKPTPIRIVERPPTTGPGLQQSSRARCRSRPCGDGAIPNRRRRCGPHALSPLWPAGVHHRRPHPGQPPARRRCDPTSLSPGVAGRIDVRIRQGPRSVAGHHRPPGGHRHAAQGSAPAGDLARRMPAPTILPWSPFPHLRRQCGRPGRSALRSIRCNPTSARSCGCNTSRATARARSRCNSELPSGP